MLIHDSFLVIVLIAALAAWWRALQKPSFGRWLLTGICAGLAVLCKQTGILPVLALGLGVLCFTRSARDVGAYVLGGLLTCIPLVVLYRGRYDYLYNGLLGWNMAANAYVPANAKLRPFLNDIFWAHPVLWAVGTTTAVASCRHFLARFDRDDARPLTAVAGLSVVLIFVFNWMLCRQTFGQYYLQAVPLLVLLAAPTLEALSRWPSSSLARAALGLVIIYLGVVSPMMIALTPWTPDLEEKTAIARWIRQEVEADEIWEPWVYYAHLAEKEFSFYYPFLSIHSMRDDPALPSIDGAGMIPLEDHLEARDIRWIVVHEPMPPGLRTRLDRIVTAGVADWQPVRTFRVARYASEAGYQRHLWTPWWEPTTFYENVTVWRRHPGLRQAGLVGEVTIQNPTDRQYVFLDVLHPGGRDVYRLDEQSVKGRQYTLHWHQTGHAFFLSGGHALIDRQPPQRQANQLMISAAFSESPARSPQDVYQVRLPSDTDGRLCPQCAETWRCLGVDSTPAPCEQANISDVLHLTGTAYQSLRDKDNETDTGQ
jgi:hypothetical protein